jgi:hypothetical protein
MNPDRQVVVETSKGGLSKKKETQVTEKKGRSCPSSSGDRVFNENITAKRRVQNKGVHP